jgi:hypothetical protein
MMENPPKNSTNFSRLAAPLTSPNRNGPRIHHRFLVGLRHEWIALGHLDDPLCFLASTRHYVATLLIAFGFGDVPAGTFARHATARMAIGMTPIFGPHAASATASKSPNLLVRSRSP